MKAVFEALGTVAYVVVTVVILLFASDVFSARAWRWAVFVAGYVVMLVLLRRRKRRPLYLWVAAGLAALGCCIAFANLAWPLRNELSGGFFSGAGVVNYTLLPWLHTVLWIVAATAAGPAASASRTE